MRLVVSHIRMAGFGGTETYMITVAEELQRLGHEVVVYAAETGPCAEHARQRGIPVVESESSLPAGCDAVLAQDAVTAYAMAERYPDTPRVFVAHSVSYGLQFPPQAEGACHAAVVMNDRLLRRARGQALRLPVVRLRQPIDLRRFCFQTMPLEQQRPPRVLVLDNYTKGTRAGMLEQACSRAGVSLARVGGEASWSAAPEHQIARAEIVISLGRGVLEAMASGRAAYVFGSAGGDGWVTRETYPALEADGFAGRALGEPIGVERLAEDLRRWTEEQGEIGRDLASKHHSADDHCLRLLELVEELAGSPAGAPAEASELARLTRLEWGQEVTLRSAFGMADTERKEAARLRRELEVLKKSRRYRLGALLARPVDRVRARVQASRSNAPGPMSRR